MALLDTIISSTSPTLAITVLSIALLYSFYVYAFARPALPKNAPPLTTESWPIIGSMQFFTQRWSFFERQIAHSRSGNFSFYAGDKPVIGLSGDEARKKFFDSKSLGFAEGYGALLGGSPKVKQNNNPLAVAEDDQSDFAGYFTRRIVGILKGQAIPNGLPQMLKDVRTSLDDLAQQKEHVTDPFDSIYRIVFQLTMRTVACKEIADSPELLRKTLDLYETIERTATPLSIMYHWLPTPSKALRTYAGAKLYMVFKKVVDDRNKEGRRGDDALQYLIDQGDDITKIITFVLGALFAGQLNSGINAAWVLVYLANNSLWRTKALDEVRSVAARHCPDKSLPLKDQLMQVPLEAWEREFPVLDLCLKDSIRLQLSGSAFRQNTSGHPIPLNKSGSEVIPPEAYVAYGTADVHYDPSIYPNPEVWDPARYLPERAEDKKKTYAWLGWGVSRHPCLGMRFAKLENNIITAMWLAYFDGMRLEDAKGNGIEPPRCNTDNHSAKKPDVPVRLRYGVRKD